jgi:hypothetical protein
MTYEHTDELHIPWKNKTSTMDWNGSLDKATLA